MKPIVSFVLLAGLCVSGCGGGHHTATEPAALAAASRLCIPQPIIRYQDPEPGAICR